MKTTVSRLTEEPVSSSIIWPLGLGLRLPSASTDGGRGGVYRRPSHGFSAMRNNGRLYRYDTPEQSSKVTKLGSDRSLETFKVVVSLLASGENASSSAAFFRALGQVLEGSPEIGESISQTIANRPSVTLEHLAYLVFASLQYATAFSYDDASPRIIPQMRDRIARDLTTHRADVEKLCGTKNVCTNVVSRYSGLQAALSLMNREYPIRVLDIGCSMGFGLRGLNTDAVQAVPCPSDRLLQAALQQKVPIERAVGIDTQKRDMNWLLACYLPEYRADRDQAAALQGYLPDCPPFEFILADATTMQTNPVIPKDYFDVAWTSNTCYQIAGDQSGVRGAIRSALKNDGVWLYAYYRDETLLEFSGDQNPYVVKMFPKRNWVSPIEVFSSPDDKVSILSRGRDFRGFYRNYTR